MYYNQVTCKQVKSLLTPEECSLFVTTAKSLRFEPAKVSDSKVKNSILTKSRKTDVIWMEHHSGNKWLSERVDQAIRQANDELYHFSLARMSKFQYLRYRRFNFFKKHFDTGEDASGTKHSLRKLTISIQLSPGNTYLGGDFNLFLPDKVTTSRQQGDAIIFPTYLIHQAQPVWLGQRHCLVAWIEGAQPFQ